MKEGSQGKTYDADIESYSRDSLKFYKKINLESYKYLWNKDIKDDSSISGTYSKASDKEFNFPKDEHVQRTFEDYSEIKQQDLELLDYPLQTHFKNRAFSIHEDPWIYDPTNKMNQNHTFYKESSSTTQLQAESEYWEKDDDALGHFQKISETSTSLIESKPPPVRANSLHKFSRDAQRNRGKIPSFSKPKNLEADSLAYEIVGPCPSMKIYSDEYVRNNDISPKSKWIWIFNYYFIILISNIVDMESSDISTYALGNLLDALHHRPSSCNAKKRNQVIENKNRKTSKKRKKSKDNYSSNRRSSKNMFIKYRLPRLFAKHWNARNRQTFDN